MMLILQTLQTAFILGYNANGQLGVQIGAVLNTFYGLSDSAYEYGIVALSNTTCYLFSAGQVNTTGYGFLFEGLSIPSPPFGVSNYLTNVYPKQIGASFSHTIALDYGNRLHTLGKNDGGQLGRQTTQQYSAGQVNQPAWQENILTVGAVQQLSFVVYPSAIFVVGKCSHCLCGSDQNDQEDTNQYNSWHKLDLEDIPNLVITNVHFGPKQYVVQTQDGNFYFLGQSDYNNGCSSQQKHCIPQLLPFQNVKKILVTDYSTSYLKATNEIFYCGCRFQTACSSTSSIQKYDITINNIIDYFPVANRLYVLSPQGCRKFNYVNAWTIQACTFQNGQGNITRLIGYNNSIVAFLQARYLQIQVLGVGNVNLSINGLKQNFPLPISLEIKQSFTSIPYGGYVQIQIESTQHFPIQDLQIMKNENLTLQYVLQSLPVNFFQITFQLYNITDGYPFTDNIQVDITQKRTNQSIFSRIVQSGVPIQINSSTLKLYDIFTINITTQTKHYISKVFQEKITSINQYINVYLQSLEKQVLQFVDNNYDEIQNIQVSILNTDGSIRSTEITDQNGEIFVPRLQTDPQQGGFIVIVSFAGDTVYQAYRQQHYLHFDGQTQTISISFNNNFFFVEITYQTSGNITFYAQNGSQFYNISLPITVNNTQVYIQRVFIQKIWNVQNKTVTAKFEDSSSRTYAIDITKELRDGVSFSFHVMPKVQTITLLFVNQTNTVVANHLIKLTSDNYTTIMSYYTNQQGQISFQLNTYDMLQNNESIIIWADETSIYAGLNETIINPNTQQQPYTIQIYQFATFQLTFYITDSIAQAGVPGITLLLKNQAGNILFNKTSDSQGRVQITVSEQQKIIAFNTQYTIQLEDSNNQYNPYTNFFYTNNPTITENYILNAHRITFQVYDSRTNQIAQGAQLQITLGQTTSNCVSDNLGKAFVDFSGQFQISDLYYTIMKTDIYKPKAKTRFQYQVGLITLSVESWYNFSISVKIVDGKTNIPLNGINASIYTEAGQLQYWQVTDFTGLMQAKYSERNPIVEIGPVYNLSIVDTFGRYSDFAVNYSISSPNEYDTLPLNIQQVTLVVTNYDANRVGDIRAVIYSNKEFIGEYTTNQLGIINFYVRSQQFHNKKLTYTIMQSDNYRPKAPNQIKVSQNPQIQVVRVFPLIIYKFNINISLPENETNVTINFTNMSMQQMSIKQVRKQQYNMLNSQISSLKYDINENPYNQNLKLQFLSKNNTILYTSHIDNIFNPTKFQFIENINQTFKLNNIYKLKIVDETDRYKTIELNFTIMSLNYTFDVTLERQIRSTHIPPYISIGILSGVLMIAFMIFAIIKLTIIKKNFRKMYKENGLHYSKKTYDIKEQDYIEQCVKELNGREEDILEEIHSHSIMRNRVIKQQTLQLEMYYEEISNMHHILMNQHIDDLILK